MIYPLILSFFQSDELYMIKSLSALFYLQLFLWLPRLNFFEKQRPQSSHE